jgi:hypothetical protein
VLSRSATEKKVGGGGKKYGLIRPVAIIRHDISEWKDGGKRRKFPAWYAEIRGDGRIKLLQ